MSDTSPAHDTTRLLHRSARGDQQAIDKLMPVIYDELHDLAERFMRKERAGHSLQATALVGEAYMKLIDQQNVDVNDRTHFFAVAATTIRRILVDHAKRRDADKRGGGGDWQRITLAAVDAPGSDAAIDLLDLNEALDKLTELSARAAQVVTMRYFGGLSVDEVAAALKVSPRTVADDWAMARAWLKRALGGKSREPGQAQ